MKPQSSTTLPPCNSDHNVIVETWQMTRPPSRSKPPRRAGYFPVIFTILIVHPSPSVPNLVRYKTKYEFWLNCDDFSGPGGAAAAVNRLVDLMNVPFPLQDVQLFWKEHAGSKSGIEEVADWNCMVARLSWLLRQVNDFVRRKQGDDEEYPLVKLQISKFVKLSEEELETAARGRVNGEWNMRALWRPQMEMEWRMAVLQAQAIERVKLEGGGHGGACGICWEDMSVGWEVARLPCSHCSHERCILSWLEINNSCPFCRYIIAAIEGIAIPIPKDYSLPPQPPLLLIK